MANRNFRSIIFNLMWITSITTLLVCLFRLESNRSTLQPQYRQPFIDFPIEMYLQTDKSYESTPDIKKSKVTIVNKKAIYTVGDRLNVHIVLYDTGGKIRYGGDILRIWLKENNSNVNGEVLYNGNGSYTGSVVLPWKGQPKLYVSIANTRRQISHVLTQLYHYGLIYPILAKFINKKQQVAVMECSPYPNIKHWHGTCNLTQQNYNVLWYSDKPSNPGIECSDWKYLNQSKTTYLSEREIKNMRENNHLYLNTYISVPVKGGAKLIYDHKTKCSSMKRSLTWEHNSPAGYYYKGSWVVPWCRSTIKKDKNDYYKCLKNRHLLIIGDSNSRSVMSYLQSFLRLKSRTGFMIAGRPWHKFTFAERPDLNVSTSWAVHETPFHSWPFFEKELLKPSFVRLDEIGRGNNSIILIHMYFHFARTTTEIFRDHVRRLRVSIEDLLQRAPDVDIFIKGPHANRYKSMVDPLDFISRIHFQIWTEEFKGLYDKVVYLDMWDITAGSESLNSHPGATTLSDMVYTFFSYACK